MTRQIFYSFHFANDVMRVQQIRNIGVIEGNRPVTPNKWEEIKRGGVIAIEEWIDQKINYASCVVVLIGSGTSQSRWLKYEIKKAWNEGKGLVGIRIHNLKDPRTGISTKGVNPFDNFNVNGIKLSKFVKTYDPGFNAYSWIQNHINTVVEEAIRLRNNS